MAARATLVANRFTESRKSRNLSNHTQRSSHREQTPMRDSLPHRTARTAICAAVAFVFIASTAFAQGSWTTETRLPKSLQEVSVVGFNGQVYVFGGSIHKVTTNSSWSYDPATRVWTSRAP
jgi:hypothetical protein